MSGKNQFPGYQPKVPRLLGVLQKSGVMTHIVQTTGRVYLEKTGRSANSCIDLKTGKLWLSSDVPYAAPRHHAMHRVISALSRTAMETASASRVDSILRTGDGTFERPLMVGSILEEYVVLSQMISTTRRRPRLQGLMSDTVPPMDCTDLDSRVIHFDISTFLKPGTFESELAMCRRIAARWKEIGSLRGNPRELTEVLLDGFEMVE